MNKQEKPAVELFGPADKGVLRKKWEAMNRPGSVVLFADLHDFLDWCVESKWTYGLKLKRYDTEAPFSRENCYWEPMKGDIGAMAIAARKWDEFVGPIRERLRPYLDDIDKKKAEQQIVFRYEHPDLVREGIVWKEGAPTEEF